MFRSPAAKQGRSTCKFLPGLPGALLVAAAAAGCAMPADRPGLEPWGRTDRGAATDVRVAPVPAPRPPATGSLPVLRDEASLDEHIRYAMQNSPALEAAFYRWRAAAERVPQAESLPDPQLGFAVVLDQVDRDAEYMGERYSISQMFPWFGKLSLRGDIALENAQAEAQRFEAARLELVDRVTRAWYEYAWLHQAGATARENLALLTRLESVARSLYRSGAVSQADVNRAQVELGRLDDQVRSLEDMLGPAAAELNAALGRPAHARLSASPPPPSRQAVTELPERADEEWLALARRGNPGLAAARHGVTRERHSIALARRDYYPDFSLGLEYARDGSARMAMMDGGGADMVAGMISFSIPIRRGRIAAGVREAQARLNAASRDVMDQELGLDASLKGALFSYRDSARRLALYGGTLVPKARQSMAATEVAYRAGDAAFSDLIDAQRVLLEFELAHERAAADRGKGLARIRMLVGAGDDTGPSS
ncbi:MAG TPA: TolC family protein [Gammaproteobacteria bacterium]|nr:TolC family protein [Gammaproteobacteria bacterium]